MNPVIGKAVDRVDGRLKVTGGAHYCAEMPIPNLVHAVLINSTIAKGRIVSIDTQAAEVAPGVIAILTHLNAPQIAPARVTLDSASQGGGAGEQYIPLQDDLIHYSGQHIGVVVAETLEQADRAASLVKVRYEEEPPTVTMQEAMERAFPPDNVWGKPPDIVQGDLVKGLADAAVGIDQTYTTAMQHHNAIEPHGTIAVWSGDFLTLYEPTTWVYGIRNAVAEWLQMPREKIRVIQQFVGGSFGYKGPAWTHVVLTAIAARQVNRPVKLVLTRRQEFAGVGYRPLIQHHIQLGATATGQLTALTHHAIARTSTFDNRVVAPVERTSRKIYACPNITTTYRLAPSNLSGPYTMRGPGETPGLFAIESAMDELAYALQIDPIELRLRNHADVDPETGDPWSSKSLKECYRQGAERFGWHQRNPQPGSMRNGDRLVGWGMATMAYDARFSGTTASAQLFADGNVLVQSSTCDPGTGVYTIMQQIAADTLGLSVASIRFQLGDTQMPEAPVAAGSKTTASVGSAVYAATTSLQRKLLNLAFNNPNSPLYGHTEAEVTVDNGRCYLKDNPTQGQTYVEILQQHQMESISAQEQVKPDEETKKFTHYSFGAHFAEVQFHPGLSELRITRYVGAFAAGRIVNPKTAHSQLIGGIIWGIGMALMEQSIVDPHLGRIVNSNLAEYLIPVNADIPSIDAFFVEEEALHLNPIGTKGIGEIGTVGAAAAIANAVYHATGKRIRDLPITLDKLL
ncbi:xanthine dehydrogenase family protein molybdopterin-binding subunit [Nostoc sp.]|uniref:xanthine dehydrogenase family protein molybdopterin-binding subunit n=1 Tax=Nostoc sp. TaxID=1180 RepID=UPI002FFD3081